jgi:hypothetical protein
LREQPDHMDAHQLSQRAFVCSSLWCNVVNKEGLAPGEEQREIAKMKPRSALPVRASISFPPDLYETLEDIAREKKVSLAWVVRAAVERYVAAQRTTVGEVQK